MKAEESIFKNKSIRPARASLPGRQNVTGIIESMVLVHSNFPHTKEPRKLSAIWALALKNIRKPGPRLKKFEGLQIISLPWVPTCLGPALHQATHKPHSQCGKGSHMLYVC